MSGKFRFKQQERLGTKWSRFSNCLRIWWVKPPPHKIWGTAVILLSGLLRLFIAESAGLGEDFQFVFVPPDNNESRFHVVTN
jgi:hypothetical protein